MLRIAVQKSGRLYEDSARLLHEAGIDFGSSPNRLRAQASNFPLEVIFLRDDDIPEYVEEGVVHLGIVGENVLLEKHKTVKTVDRLGFGKCRLSIALRILRNFLTENNINAEIHDISGAVEIAPSLGLAEGIFDIVSTGSTLLANGLREVQTVLKSEALLVANTHLTGEQEEIINRLMCRINAHRNAKKHRYILLNAPKDRLDEVIAAIPGMKSPTILPLAIEGWCSVHSVIPEDVFWEVLERLKAAGAEGILVAPLERMIL
jgi:ATP phosphoribosyltransferase